MPGMRVADSNDDDNSTGFVDILLIIGLKFIKERSKNV